MTAPGLRQLVVFVVAGLLCGTPIVPQEPGPVSATHDGPNDNSAAQSPGSDPQSSEPRPNPKYAKKVTELGDKAAAQGHLDEALSYYQEAIRYAPQDENLIERVAQLRSTLVRAHTDAAERDALAGHADVAIEELAKALLIDPDNTIVAERMKEMKAMGDGPAAKSSSKVEGLPELQPKPGKQDLKLVGDVRTVYHQLADQFGIKVAFDPDLPARNVRLNVDDVDFDTALKVITAETGTFYRPLTPALIFVAQDTTEKRRQYQPQAERSFVLPAAVNNEEMTELLRLIREMTGATRIELDSASRAITVRDTPEKLALIGELIHQAEKARGELMLEIEILEVDRNKARDLGILPPASTNLTALAPNIVGQLEQAQDIGTAISILASILGSGSSSSGTLSIPPVELVGGGKTTFLLGLPTIAAQFSDALSLVHSGNQVLLRAQDGKPASFFVGERYPITLSLLSGSLGATTFVPGTAGSPTTTFSTTAYNVGNGPVAITAADFRDLGLLDLAVVNQLDNTVTILQNQGSGTYLQAGLPIALGAAPANAPTIAPSIASAIFTSSGFHDLLVTDSDQNTVTVLLSNGDDTFKEATGSPITVGKQPSDVITGDFNNDGNQDFIVTNFTDNTFSVFFGNGDGTFKQAPGSPFPLPSSSSGPIALVTADFNLDGIPDIAIVNRTTNNVSVLLGTSTATFQLAPSSPFPVGNFPVAIATGDLNEDGKPDLAVLNQTDSTVSPLLGNGDGTFTLAPNSPLGTGTSPTAVAIADFIGEGEQDIIVTDPETASVSVYLNQGSAVFASPIQLPAGTNPTAMVAAGLAGDLPDVAVTDDVTGAVGQVTVIVNPITSGTTGTGGLAQEPYPGSEYEDIGLKIKATPTLHANDEVSLQLDFEIRALAGSNINGIPIITNRTISQMVRVKEGQPTILSGMLDNEETRSITGVPGLATLPGIGYAFGQRNTTVQDTELLILVTPRKLRLRDRISRTVYAGRASAAGNAAGGGRGAGVPATPEGPVGNPNAPPNAPAPNPTPTPPPRRQPQ
jgi:Flp pilus assembly secretin CpaC